MGQHAVFDERDKHGRNTPQMGQKTKEIKANPQDTLYHPEPVIVMSILMSTHGGAEGRGNERNRM